MTSSAGSCGLIAGRVASEVRHRVAHSREIDHRRDAGEVLQEHAGGSERDLVRRRSGGLPAPQRLGVVLLAVAERVLEQDPEGVGEPLGALQREDLVALAAGAEGGRAHLTDCMERPAGSHLTWSALVPKVHRFSGLIRR